jgi:creatinine amidohydrolase/Fe(II)-dependent formamide hydrolase-like protein
MLEGVARRHPALLAPLLPIGCSEHHMGFAGSMSLREDTLLSIVRDCCQTLAHHGFQYIMIYSGHRGNSKPLERIIARIQQDVAPGQIIGCTTGRYTTTRSFSTRPAAASTRQRPAVIRANLKRR